MTMMKKAKTRHRHGVRATPRQLDVLLRIVGAAGMDKSWFGEVRESEAEDGNTVHVVRDMKRKSWLSLKYAVSKVDREIGSARDYVTAGDADIYEEMLRQIGIVDREEDEESAWFARFVSKSRFKLGTIVSAIKEEDRRKFRFRPLYPRVRRDKGMFYLDFSSQEMWSRSMALWLARRSDMRLAFEVWFIGHDKVMHHVVYDGERVKLAEADDAKPLLGRWRRWKEMMSPHDIVGVRADSRTSGRSPTRRTYTGKTKIKENRNEDKERH